MIEYEFVIYFNNKESLSRAVYLLLNNCQHPHWFNVKLGDPRYSLSVSRSGLTCLRYQFDEIDYPAYGAKVNLN